MDNHNKRVCIDLNTRWTNHHRPLTPRQRRRWGEGKFWFQPLTAKFILEYGLAELSEGSAVIQSRRGGYRGEGDEHTVLAEGDYVDARSDTLNHMYFLSLLVSDVHTSPDFRVGFDMGCNPTVYLKVPLSLHLSNVSNDNYFSSSTLPPKSIAPSFSHISSFNPLLIVSTSLRSAWADFKEIRPNFRLARRYFMLVCFGVVACSLLMCWLLLELVLQDESSEKK